MNDLIATTTQDVAGEEISTVNARELYRALEIRKDFSDWIKVQIARLQLEENVDFILLPFKGEQDWGGNNRIDYYLTVEAARNVAAISETPKGREVVRELLKEVAQAKRLEKAHREWHKAEHMLGSLLIEHLGVESAQNLYDRLKNNLGLPAPKASKLHMTPALREFLQLKTRPLSLQEFDIVVNVLSKT